MAIFNSSNPTLSEKIFSKSLDGPGTGMMTVRGSMQKFGFSDVAGICRRGLYLEIILFFQGPDDDDLF